MGLAALSLTLCTNPTFIEFSRYVGPSAIRPAGFDSDLQWNMEMINAPGAWAVMGDDSVNGPLAPVLVAVLDTGIAADHDGLSGIVELEHGANPADGGAPVNTDPNGHGTHVAGIIAAMQTSPGIGVFGTTQDIARLISVKVFPGSTRTTSSSILVAGMQEVLSLTEAFVPVRVVNLSLGGGGTDAALYYEIQRLVDVGITVVAATGNSNREGVFFPAWFDNTIAVGATNSTSLRWVQGFDGSNYGVGIDLMAPGANILSLDVPNTYDYKTGTSMATPHVAGVAALLYAVEPGLNQAAVYSILRATARDLGAPGWDKYYGHGLVDAQAALEYLINLRRRIPRAPMGQEPGGGSGGLRINVAELSGAQLPPPEAEIDAATLIVRFADGTDASDSLQLQTFADAVSDQVGASAVRAVGTDTAVVELLAGQSVIEALQQVAGVTGVQFSQPNYVYRAVW